MKYLNLKAKAILFSSLCFVFFSCSTKNAIILEEKNEKFLKKPLLIYINNEVAILRAVRLPYDQIIKIHLVSNGKLHSQFYLDETKTEEILSAIIAKNTAKKYLTYQERVDFLSKSKLPSLQYFSCSKNSKGYLIGCTIYTPYNSEYVYNNDTVNALIIDQQMLLLQLDNTLKFTNYYIVDNTQMGPPSKILDIYNDAYLNGNDEIFAMCIFAPEKTISISQPIGLVYSIGKDNTLQFKKYSKCIYQPNEIDFLQKNAIANPGSIVDANSTLFINSLNYIYEFNSDIPRVALNDSLYILNYDIVDSKTNIVAINPKDILKQGSKTFYIISVESSNKKMELKNTIKVDDSTIPKVYKDKIYYIKLNKDKYELYTETAF